MPSSRQPWVRVRARQLPRHLRRAPTSRLPWTQHPLSPLQPRPRRPAHTKTCRADGFTEISVRTREKTIGRSVVHSRRSNYPNWFLLPRPSSISFELRPSNCNGGAWRAPEQGPAGQRLSHACGASSKPWPRLRERKTDAIGRNQPPEPDAFYGEPCATKRQYLSKIFPRFWQLVVLIVMLLVVVKYYTTTRGHCFF